MLEKDRVCAAWIEEAKIVALLGGCRQSLNSFRSDLRYWMDHAGIALGLRG